MSHMFDSCRLLNTLNLYNFNTKKIKDMSYKFLECNILTYLNISNFDISKVKKKEGMFEGLKIKYYFYNSIVINKMIIIL